MDTPFQTKSNTPSNLQHDEAMREEADQVDEMIQDNIDALIARQLASLNSADQAFPASSDSILKAMMGAFRKIDFDYSDAPGDARGSAARGSNEPPPKVEGLDENRNIEHWKTQTPVYIRKQLRLMGWRRPTENINDVSKDKLLIAILSQLGINPSEGIQPAKRGRPLKIN